MSSFSGIWTALVTPFLPSGEIDEPSFIKIIRQQIEAGVTGIIPCGTTGESPTLSTDEKKKLITLALKEAQGTSVQVFAGTGSNNTKESIELSKWASQAGVKGLLVVTPYYNKPTPAGLEKHFTAIADAVSCEIMLYNVPGRTGLSMQPQTIVNLSKHPKITALKEATGDVAFTSTLLYELGKARTQLDILSGDDLTYLPLLSVGAKGIVSVASNLIPREMVTLHNAAMKGDLKTATELHKKYFPLFKNLFVEANPSPIKFAMSRAGFGQSHVRLPLVDMTETSKNLVTATLAECGL